MLTKKRILIYFRSFSRYEPEDVHHYQKTHTDWQNCEETKWQDKGGGKRENQRGENHIKKKIEDGF